jgi:hypothetical protein
MTLDTCNDTIAVHRFGKIGRRDVDVALALSRVEGPALAGLRLIGDDESEATWVCREPPYDQVHLFGQAVTVATDLEELARNNQCFLAAPEACALFARHSQHPHQVPHGGGIVSMLPNLGQEVSH